MDSADKGRVESFLIKWIGSEGNERANYQGFFLDFCDALGVEKPQPKGNAADAPYCFDKDIKFYSSNKTAPTTRFADFYKEGCFLIEAKQGSESCPPNQKNNSPPSSRATSPRKSLKPSPKN